MQINEYINAKRKKLHEELVYHIDKLQYALKDAKLVLDRDDASGIDPVLESVNDGQGLHKLTQNMLDTYVKYVKYNAPEGTEYRNKDAARALLCERLTSTQWNDNIEPCTMNTSDYST